MTPLLSDHFNGKTFFQPHHATSGRIEDLLRWKLFAKPATWPAKVTVPTKPLPPVEGDDGAVATWIGHATFLLRSARSNVLFDPVFSERASPVAWAGPLRVHAPGVPFEALPTIDAVLLSHDHYDHCDTDSLTRLARKHQPQFLAPLRHRDLLAKTGAERIAELDWWESHSLAEDVTVTLTPSKHWSNRFGTPKNYRLWGGFFLQLGQKKIWFVGDSGYDAEMVRAVRERCGSPDLALVPIGAYSPRWFMAPMHMNPEEAVRLHIAVGARLSIGMHWGTFQLTDEGRDDPPVALAAAADAARLDPEAFRVLAPGESIVV